VISPRAFVKVGHLLFCASSRSNPETDTCPRRRRYVGINLVTDRRSSVRSDLVAPNPCNAESYDDFANSVRLLLEAELESDSVSLDLAAPEAAC
jgi:hypothetical protein